VCEKDCYICVMYVCVMYICVMYVCVMYVCLMYIDAYLLPSHSNIQEFRSKIPADMPCVDVIFF